MEDILRQHVGQPRSRRIGEIEHQQVFDAAPRSAHDHLAMRLGDLVEPRDDFQQQLPVPGHRAGHQRRRQEGLVQRDAAIGSNPLEVGDRQGRVATDRFAGRQQQRLRPGDFDFFRV